MARRTLTAEQKAKAVELYRQGTPSQELARRFGVSTASIMNAVRTAGFLNPSIYTEIRRNKRDAELWCKYRITTNDYARMFSEQSGLCAICLELAGDDVLHVDHCHKTGRIRGLLCRSCNLLLGMAKDNPEILESAISYMNRHNGDRL